MCTHLHHDHVGWNTQLRDGRWVPTFPNARYVFSKPDFDYFQRLDIDPALPPAESGTFRECVVPVVEAGRADLVTGPHRLNEHLEILPAPGHSAGHVVFKLESAGRWRALHRRRVPSPAAGLLPALEFSEELGPRTGPHQPPDGARPLRLDRGAGVARSRRRAVRRPHRSDREGIYAAVLIDCRNKSSIINSCRVLGDTSPRKRGKVAPAAHWVQN